MRNNRAISQNLSQKNEGKRLNYYYNRPGSNPGTFQIPKNAFPTDITLIDYDANQQAVQTHLNPNECTPYLDSLSVSWFDVVGLANQEILFRLAEIFNLGKYLLEDVINIPHRPKIQEFPHHLLIITHMVIPKLNHQGFWLEQVSLILGKNYLISIQEEPSMDCFALVRERIKNNTGIIRQKGSDYLAYALWDAIIDGYFPVLEIYRERLEDLEEEVIFKPTEDTLTKIYRFKRELLLLRRGIFPQNQALKTLIAGGAILISDEVRTYLKDCQDHTVQVVDLIDSSHELLEGLLGLYLSSMGNKTNELMKVFTIVSTIFIPLTFIAGIYGMNFNTENSPWNMPELDFYWGYLLCLVLMLTIATSLIMFFWQRGWLKTQIPKSTTKLDWEKRESYLDWYHRDI